MVETSLKLGDLHWSPEVRIEIHVLLEIKALIVRASKLCNHIVKY